MSSTRGLAVGKFWPPHAGHVRLIRKLTTNCERVFILVCASKNQVPSGIQRSMWLQAMFPEAEVVVDNDWCAWHYPGECRTSCTELWAGRVKELGLLPIHVVAAGESYAEGFAKALQAKCIWLDRHDEVSRGTSIREDLAGNWLELPRVVRAGLYRRVVILGAESTGTSTLASDLSRCLNAPLVAEVGRTYSWQLFAQAGSMGAISWSEENFWQIVNSQIQLERDSIWGDLESLPGTFGPWLVCDTDTLATVAWWERYLNHDNKAIQKFANSRLADFYVHTSPDGIEFDDSDPLRDGAHVRLAMSDRFRALLVTSGRPWLEVAGSREARVEQVINALRKYEAESPRWIHS